jgi:hypothetical protein
VNNLRQALDCIQYMLDGKPYSAALWDVLSAIRGPDCRNHSLKTATTMVIRDAAFPKHPCEERSFYAKDNAKSASRRKKMFSKKGGRPHFREHVRDAFECLGLSLFEVNGGANGIQNDIGRNNPKAVGRRRRSRTSC